MKEIINIQESYVIEVLSIWDSGLLKFRKGNRAIAPLYPLFDNILY